MFVKANLNDYVLNQGNNFKDFNRSLKDAVNEHVVAKEKVELWTAQYNFRTLLVCDSEGNILNLS